MSTYVLFVYAWSMSAQVYCSWSVNWKECHCLLCTITWEVSNIATNFKVLYIFFGSCPWCQTDQVWHSTMVRYHFCLVAVIIGGLYVFFIMCTYLHLKMQITSVWYWFHINTHRFKVYWFIQHMFNSLVICLHALCFKCKEKIVHSLGKIPNFKFFASKNLSWMVNRRVWFSVLCEWRVVQMSGWNVKTITW